MQTGIYIEQKSCMSFFTLDSLPQGINLNWSNLRSFADDKMKVTKTLKFVLGWAENIVGKEENAGNGRKHCGKRRKCWLPAFSPFPTMFSKGFLLQAI